MFELKNLSNEQYHNGKEYREYWSSSNFPALLISPRYAYYEKFEKENKRTESMRFGSLLHEFLECKALGNNFWENHEIRDFLKKDGTSYATLTDAFWQWEEINPEAVRPIEAEKIQAIWGILRNDPLIKFFLTGQPEISLFDEDNKTKVRKDITLSKYIIDWKTTNPANLNEKGIKKVIENYDYDLKAAMYQDHECRLTGILKEFIWVFIANEPPFDFVIVNAKNYIYDNYNGTRIKNCGAVMYEKCSEIYGNACKNGFFEGTQSNIESNHLGQKIMVPSPNAYRLNNY
jgi:hypothetical protein